MRCLPFLHGESKEEDPITMSASVPSLSTTSTEQDVRSGSGFNSMNVSDMSAESMRRTQYPSFTDRPTNLRVFSFSELKNATRNFSRSLMVGEGGFGCVYRGVIKNSDEPSERIEIAIKQLNRKGLQGQKEWLTEMNVLGIVEHPNLVKLIGYCADDDERGIQRLLVYEYMPNGSVDDHLSNRDGISGYFPRPETSNILLDENWNAKLSDFGLARHGPSEGLTHVSTAVVGTLGYAAPEYMQTGRLTAKSDVWGYGVLLYELITGRRPIDRNRPKGEQKLLDWVKPYISDVKRFPIIIDPRLEGHYNLRSMTKLARVANRCLVRLPKSRPKMSEVYVMVQKIVDSIETGMPQPPLHYHGSVSEPGAKRTKKGSLKRRFQEFKFGCRQIVWRGWRPEIIKTC
ncbi:hypothetical protein GUJ93_ZPchr0002g23786 [Zizania palustris]|uniref:non-specific serine/threonine protein kinase n=1 Tax=Zizania palustris TaxID=103762 RepID=A0A8J5S0C3_ZIZPA|nr:hypothetical protein GUJ93_ZPchr0002g23786 [Zizania palustris]